MENQICPLHDTPMVAKEGNFGTYHSHIIQNVGFCNGRKITPFKEKPQGQVQAVTQTITREPLPQRDFDKENRGKVRHGIVVALIEHSGTEALKGIADNVAVRKLINEVCEFVMSGEDL